MGDLARKLIGKVAIVTCSARNIGRATALNLAQAGASLVINSPVLKEMWEEIAHEIESTGSRAPPFAADITDTEAVSLMVAATISQFGGIDILVNNAAEQARRPFVDLDTNTLHYALRAALQSAFHITKGCVFGMTKRAGRTIIGVGSFNSYRGQPEGSHVMGILIRFFWGTAGITSGARPSMSAVPPIARFRAIKSREARRCIFTFSLLTIPPIHTGAPSAESPRGLFRRLPGSFRRPRRHPD